MLAVCTFVQTDEERANSFIDDLAGTLAMLFREPIDGFTRRAENAILHSLVRARADRRSRLRHDQFS